MAFGLKRRHLFIAAGGSVAATAVLVVAGHEKGATWLTKHWIAQLVRDSLPGTPIDEASLAAFALEAAHGHQLLRRPQAHAEPAWRHLLHWPDAGAEQQQLERELVSWFLTGSDFFQRPAGSAEPVVYRGRSPACGNMFATFREEA